MEIRTESFKDDRRNTIFKCGMVDRPYTRSDNCTNLAVVRVTDDGWHEYQNYRIRYNKVHKCGCGKDLPIMMRPLLCEEHLHQIQKLVSDPRVAARH